MIIDIVTNIIIAILASIIIALIITLFMKRMINDTFLYKPLKNFLKESNFNNLLRLNESPTVFVSYSFQDSDFTNNLINDLNKFSIKVWNLNNEILPGDDIKNKINEGFENCGYLIAIISKSSANSKWFLYELENAYKRELLGNWPIVIPLKIDDISLPNILKDKMYLDFRNNYKSNLIKLIATITKSSSSIVKEEDAYLLGKLLIDNLELITYQIVDDKSIYKYKKQLTNLHLSIQKILNSFGIYDIMPLNRKDNFENIDINIALNETIDQSKKIENRIKLTTNSELAMAFKMSFQNNLGWF